MFSPELRDAGRDALLNRAIWIGEPGVAGRVAGALDFGDDVFDELLKVGRPRDEIRLAVHFDQNAARDDPRDTRWPMSPSLIARPAFLAALARPRFRRIRLASSKLPLASVRAALHSIIPAPVWSRSFFTSAAVILAMGDW